MTMFNSSLCLLSDPSREVRMEYSDMALYCGNSVEVMGLFVDKILTLTASSSADTNLLETLITTILCLSE